ncbi:MAG TPA: SDR family NAD(P)-dependent oxidoreductase [Pseudolabrys sp.]|nr:SDR family NAD(P)-dependent oxidoreductase [Pseudolabrys sp.]
MTAPLIRPKRKDPLKKTRQPLYPQAIRSRTAQGLTAAAAQGRFELQTCADCKTVFYPPRDACPKCLSARVPFVPVDNRGVILAETAIHTSTDPYFRERTPWRAGLAKLDCGPVVLSHLHGDVREGERVRLDLKLDKGGAPVMIALPEKDTPNMADDPQLREMTCDPKFRRVLITNGRTAVGQAMAKAFSEAGASIVFVGVADPWKPFPGHDALRAVERVEIVPLDVTDTESVTEQAEQNGGRVDILVNTAEHVRPGGILQRHGLTVAREEMDVRYFGLMRLAQAFGPAMRSRGADGVNSAAAFVNLLSVHALMNWPAYGAYSAAEAASLSAAQCMRAELRPGGVKVLNVFFGPLETEWFQTVPPPKVTPAALARAVVQALQRGLEDAFVGDIAEDVRARLAVNPKALEREMAG